MYARYVNTCIYLKARAHCKSCLALVLHVLGCARLNSYSKSWLQRQEYTCYCELHHVIVNIYVVLDYYYARFCIFVCVRALSPLLGLHSAAWLARMHCRSRDTEIGTPIIARKERIAGYGPEPYNIISNASYCLPSTRCNCILQSTLDRGPPYGAACHERNPYI